MNKSSILAPLLCLALTAGAAAPATAAADPTPAGAAQGAGHYIADTALTAKVKTALLAQKGLSALGIDVESTAGVVTLSGTVPDKAQVQLALATAQQVDGVKDVHDALRVEKGRS